MEAGGVASGFRGVFFAGVLGLGGLDLFRFSGLGQDLFRFLGLLGSLLGFRGSLLGSLLSLLAFRIGGLLSLGGGDRGSLGGLLGFLRSGLFRLEVGDDVLDRVGFDLAEAEGDDDRHGFLFGEVVLGAEILNGLLIAGVHHRGMELVVAVDRRDGEFGGGGGGLGGGGCFLGFHCACFGLLLIQLLADNPILMSYQLLATTFHPKKGFCMFLA